MTKTAERFAAATELSPVTTICWHSDGRQFMCGHQNGLNLINFLIIVSILGSLSIWNVRKPRELVYKATPHSPNASSGGGSSPSSCDVTPTTTFSSHYTCKPITQLSWNINSDGEQLIIFAGG